jgi:hypothetical protein
MSEEEYPKYFEITISYGDKLIYCQKLHEFFINVKDPEIITRVIASVNNLQYPKASDV